MWDVTLSATEATTQNPNTVAVVKALGATTTPRLYHMAESTLQAHATVPIHGSEPSITVQPHGLTAGSSSHHPFSFIARSEVYHHGSAATHGGTSHHEIAMDYGPILEQVHLFHPFSLCLTFSHAYTSNEISPRAIGLHTILSSRSKQLSRPQP